MRRIATRGGGFAAFRVDALDRGEVRHLAVAFVTYNRDEKPSDGIRVGRRDISHGFADYPAAIVCRPRGAGKMFAEGFAGFIEELGVGSFYRPGELRAVIFAHVDLIALGVELEEKMFARRRLEFLGISCAAAESARPTIATARSAADASPRNIVRMIDFSPKKRFAVKPQYN